MTVSEFPTPAEKYPDQEQWNRVHTAATRQIMLGRMNNVLDVTLDASSASTTVTDARIGVNTVAICVPTTVNAEALAIWPYRDFSAPVNGSMSVIHTSDANSDLTFKMILVG
jgi:hypothetical protein|tara:strand:+ start:141 stop:476 length:336 start_codon:yes stop_codon:yes gene_type:complete